MNKKKIILVATAISMLVLGACSKSAGTIGAEESGNFNLDELINSGSLGVDADALPDWVTAGINGADDGSSDGLSDWLLGDIDGDGVPNYEDTDMDGDGIANSEDSDMDGNGLDDSVQTTAPAPAGSPSNPIPGVDAGDPTGDDYVQAGGTGGTVDDVPDWVTNDDGTLQDWTEGDLDGDGVANWIDVDMDGDGIINSEDTDMDGNGVDDSQQTTPPPPVGSPENPAVVKPDVDPDAGRGQSVTITRDGEATMKVQPSGYMYVGSDGLELQEIRDEVESSGGDPKTITVADEGVIISVVGVDPADANKAIKVRAYYQFAGDVQVPVLESASGLTIADLADPTLVLNKNLVKSGDGSGFDGFIEAVRSSANPYADFIIEVESLDGTPLSVGADFTVDFQLIVNAKGSFI